MPLFSPLDLPDSNDDEAPPESGITNDQFADSVRSGLSEPSLDVTQGALPLGTVPTGDGAGGTPDPPEQPDFPRVDVEEDLAMDEPEKDTEARRQNKLTALLGAIGTTIAAAGDDPVALNVAGGLAQGAAQDNQRRQKSFQKRQQAFQNLVSEATQFNRKQRQKEVEADFERRLSRFEQRRKDDRQQAEATQERIQAQREREFEQRQSEREHERSLEEIEARTEGRMDELQFQRGTRLEEQRLENQNEAGNGGGQREPIDMTELEIPRDPQEARRRLQIVNTRLEEMRANKDQFTSKTKVPRKGEKGFVMGERVVERTDEEFRERMSRLEQYKQNLQRVAQQGQARQTRGGRSSAQPGRSSSADTVGTQPVSRDTSAVPSDTSTVSRDTTTAAPGTRQPQPAPQDTSAAPRDTTTALRDTSQQGGRGDRGGQGSQGGQSGYVGEINQTLQARGKRAALNKIADDLEAGRITPRQANALTRQVAPDSLLNR